MDEMRSQETNALFPNERIRALYRHGVEQQWDVARAVDWSALRLERLPGNVRREMANVYSDILYAERFGLELVLRIAEQAPEGWLREFAGLQVRDEMRHVDFFARVVGKLGGVAEVAEELVCLRWELSALEGHAELTLHGHILECGARALFVGNAKRSLEVIGKNIRLPGSESVSTLMHAIVDYVGRDEARHIAMGVLSLRASLTRLRTPERRAVEERARVTAGLLYRSLLHRSHAFERLGLSSDDILARVWLSIRNQLGRLEFDIGDPDLTP